MSREPEPADPSFSVRMLERYSLRKETGGWTVFDVWTGQPVVIARQPQTGLNRKAAGELTALLNEQVRQGNRVVLQ